jgi:hypothetical protein
MTTIHDPIQRRLIIALIVYECFVISATAYAGITIALSGGAPLFAAIPVLMVSASEGLRIPLSAWATRLSYNNRLLAVAVLGCLALASAEGVSLSLDSLFAARVQSVTVALDAVDRAKAELAAAESRAAPIRDAIKSADKQIAAAEIKQAALITATPASPGFSGARCGKYGNRPCAVDSTAQATYRKALADHGRQMAAIDAERKAAVTARADAANSLAAIDLAGPQSAVSRAERQLADAAQNSPVHRIAGSIFGVKAALLSEEQMQTFRKYAIGGLSLALACMSGLVGWLAFQEPVPKQESKLSRALRAYVARRRKPIIRIVEKPVPAGMKVKYVYVPTAPEEGLLKRAGFRSDKVRAYSEMN